MKLLLNRKKDLYSEVLIKWLENKKGAIKEQSYIKYLNFINLYIIPYLGTKNYKLLNQ